jgi:hypothetical protein
MNALPHWKSEGEAAISCSFSSGPVIVTFIGIDLAVKLRIDSIWRLASVLVRNPSKLALSTEARVMDSSPRLRI